MNASNFWKLWGFIGGYVVGLLFAWAAYAGLASCTDPTAVDTCTLFGMSPEMAKNLIAGIFGALGVVVAPKNVEA